MKSQYDAVVVGSGFGGAVAACRLTQAGFRVAVIERGRRYAKGQFPRNFRHPSGWLYARDGGLFDVRPLNEMTVLQGAGWGGGSLVYANVQIRPPADVFASGWPEGYSRAALDPYYDLVAAMLEVAPITQAALGLPAKTLRMQEAARQLGRSDQLIHPNLAVDFAPPRVEHRNRFGVAQEGCQYCGECIIGCNVLAKNTLDLNYLALAERGGADPLTSREVTSIEPTPGGYRVVFRDPAAPSGTGAVQARTVFLGAGAIGTTELLLRCRDQHRTLPALSPRLGHGYSGNGDFLAFGFGLDRPFEAAAGPAITSGIVFDRRTGGDHTWCILEEGGGPQVALVVAQFLDPDRGWLGEVMAGAGALGEAQAAFHAAAAAALREEATDVSRTALFFGMGRDRGAGQVLLLPSGRLYVHWDYRQDLGLYSTQERLVRDIVGALGGRTALNPLWRWFRVPMTVHNLGGCPMGNSAATGVTGPDGQVHNYPGLYVVDGSVLPSATGVNPSQTIAAVAERNVEAFIRIARGDPSWSAPERAQAPRIHDPVDSIRLPQGGSPEPTRGGALGLYFRESWHGWIDRQEPADPPATRARRAGARGLRFMECHLEAAVEDIEEFLSAGRRLVVRRGHIRAHPFTDRGGALISNGAIQLRREGEAGACLTYGLPFVGADGEDYLLSGGRGASHPCTGEMAACIRRGLDRAGPVVARATLCMTAGDLFESALSVRLQGSLAPGRLARAATRLATAAAVEAGRYLATKALPGGALLSQLGAVRAAFTRGGLDDS
jgi:cholesterol oxidase